MIVKEFDTVRLKDGRTPVVLHIFIRERIVLI